MTFEELQEAAYRWASSGNLTYDEAEEFADWYAYGGDGMRSLTDAWNDWAALKNSEIEKEENER